MTVYAKNEAGTVFKFKNESSVWDGLTIVKDVPDFGVEEKAGKKAETKKGRAENKTA